MGLVYIIAVIASSLFIAVQSLGLYGVLPFMQDKLTLGSGNMNMLISMLSLKVSQWGCVIAVVSIVAMVCQILAYKSEEGKIDVLFVGVNIFTVIACVLSLF